MTPSDFPKPGSGTARLPTEAEQMARFEESWAAYERAMQAWRDGEIGARPPRPVKPHIPGFLPPEPALPVDPRDTTCGSQGVDEDGDCLRCGLPVDRETPENCPPGFLAASAVALPAAPRPETPLDREPQARFNMMRFVSRVRRACNMNSMANVREAVRQLNEDNARLSPLDEPRLIRSEAAAVSDPEDARPETYADMEHRSRVEAELENQALREDREAQFLVRLRLERELAAVRAELAHKQSAIVAIAQAAKTFLRKLGHTDLTAPLIAQLDEALSDAVGASQEGAKNETRQLSRGECDVRQGSA